MAAWGYLPSRGYHRAVYYYENGQLKTLPTREQFRVACRYFRLARVLRYEGMPFVRRLFSRAAFQSMERTGSDPRTVKAEATVYRFAKESSEAVDRMEPRPQGQAELPVRLEDLHGMDRVLARLNQIDAVRGLMIHSLTPPALMAGFGFCISSSHIANHLLFAPHPCEKAVWDIQMVQAARGGLDVLEQRVEEARRSRTLRGKMLRTLGTRRLSGAHRFELVRYTNPETGEVRYIDAKIAGSGEVVLTESDWERWYDHVQLTIVRARRFEYFVREREDPRQHYPAPTVIRFLKLCAMLEPEDYGFFEDRNIQDEYPEIGWPRVAV